MADYFIATDWKSRNDWAPIAAVSIDYTPRVVGLPGKEEPRFDPRELLTRFTVTGLEEHTDTGYREVLEHIQDDILQHESLWTREVDVIAGINDVGSTMDYISDGLKYEPLRMLISDAAGVAHYQNNVFNVPRAELFSSLSAAFSTKTVKLARGLDLKEQLLAQLVDVQVRSPAGNRIQRDSKEAGDDHLARAVAMCVWMAMQEHNRDIIYNDRLTEEFDSDEPYDILDHARKRRGGRT